MCCSREYISAIIDASAGVKLFGDTHNARRLRLFSFCMHISNNNKNIIRVMKHDSCIDPFLQMADSPDAHTHLHLHTSRNLILFSSLSTLRCARLLCTEHNTLLRHHRRLIVCQSSFAVRVYLLYIFCIADKTIVLFARKRCFNLLSLAVLSARCLFHLQTRTHAKTSAQRARIHRICVQCSRAHKMHRNRKRSFYEYRISRKLIFQNKMRFDVISLFIFSLNFVWRRNVGFAHRIVVTYMECKQT